MKLPWSVNTPCVGKLSCNALLCKNYCRILCAAGKHRLQSLDFLNMERAQPFVYDSNRWLTHMYTACPAAAFVFCVSSTRFKNGFSDMWMAYRSRSAFSVTNGDEWSIHKISRYKDVPADFVIWHKSVWKAFLIQP